MVSSSGQFTASITGRNAVALYTGALGTGTGGGNGTVTINFSVNATTVVGQVGIHLP